MNNLRAFVVTDSEVSTFYAHTSAGSAKWAAMHEYRTPEIPEELFSTDVRRAPVCDVLVVGKGVMDWWACARLMNWDEDGQVKA